MLKKLAQEKLLIYPNLRYNGKRPKNASLVQLVERRSPKPDVEGSSPSGRV